MLVLRSLIFSILFYGFFALCAVIAAAISLISPKSLAPFTRSWSRAWLAMYRAICGVNYEVRGKENIPLGGCLLAVKHQSVWDTCALFAIFDHPVYVLKSELMFIPFFGWALARLGCIPVKRGTGKSCAGQHGARHPRRLDRRQAGRNFSRGNQNNDRSGGELQNRHQPLVYGLGGSMRPCCLELRSPLATT